jgi:hypothetical protein
MSYYQRNKERCLAYNREYNMLNRDKIKEYQQSYHRKKQVKNLEVQRIWQAKQRQKKQDAFNALPIEEQRKIMINKHIDKEKRREEKKTMTPVKDHMILVSVKVKKNGEIIETYKCVK